MILIIFVTYLLSSFPGQAERFPVLLVPGDGGSQLLAKLNVTHGAKPYCYKHTDVYFPFYLNLELVLPFAINCFVDNFKLVYDREKRRSHNPPGVDIKTNGEFGDTFPVEWLDSSRNMFTKYFVSIADELVAKLGYVRNVSLRGAAFDFRFAPYEMPGLVFALKALVEEMYEKNNGTRVVLLGHSYGGIYSWLLLGSPQQVYGVDEAWRRKYVRAFIAIGTPWAGALQAMRLEASGDDMGVGIYVSPLTLRPFQRTFSSSAFLMPYADSSGEFGWRDDEVLVATPSRNYTVRNYDQFFSDLNFLDGYLMRKDGDLLLPALAPPDVELLCIYGIGLETADRLTYKASQFPDTQPTITWGDGDATVNIRSLRGCRRFARLQRAPVHEVPLAGEDHLKMLHSSAVVEQVRKFLRNISLAEPSPHLPPRPAALPSRRRSKDLL